MVRMPLSAPPVGQSTLRVRDNFLIADYTRGTLRLLVTWDQLMEKHVADQTAAIGRETRAKERGRYLQVGAVACPSLPYTPSQLRTLAVATGRASAAAATTTENSASATGAAEAAAAAASSRPGTGAASSHRERSSPPFRSASARSTRSSQPLQQQQQPAPSQRVSSAATARSATSYSSVLSPSSTTNNNNNNNNNNSSSSNVTRRQSPLLSGRTSSSPLAGNGANPAGSGNRARNGDRNAARRPPLPCVNGTAASVNGAAGISVLNHNTNETEEAGGAAGVQQKPKQLTEAEKEEAAAAMEQQFVEQQLVVVGMKQSAPVAAFDGALKVSTHKPLVQARARKKGAHDDDGGGDGNDDVAGTDMSGYQLHACEAAIDVELDTLPSNVGFIFVTLGTMSKHVNIRHASNVRVRVAFIPPSENPQQLRARMHTGGIGLVDIKNGNFSHFVAPPAPPAAPLAAGDPQQRAEPPQQVACLAVLERISATRCGRKVRNELVKMSLQLQQRQEEEYQRLLAEYNKNVAAANNNNAGAPPPPPPVGSKSKPLTAASLLLAGVTNVPADRLPKNLLLIENGGTQKDVVERAPDSSNAQKEQLSLLSVQSNENSSINNNNSSDSGLQYRDQQQHHEQLHRVQLKKDPSVAFLPTTSSEDHLDGLTASGELIFAHTAGDGHQQQSKPLAPPVPPPKPRLPIGWVVRNLGDSTHRPYLPVPSLSTFVSAARSATFEKLPRRAHFVHHKQASFSGGVLGGDESVNWLSEGGHTTMSMIIMSGGGAFAPVEEGRRAAHALGHRWEAWNSALEAVWQRHEKLNEVERWVESHSLQQHMRQPAHRRRGHDDAAATTATAAEKEKHREHHHHHHHGSEDGGDEDEYEWSSDEDAIADECFVTLLEQAKAEEALDRCPSVDSEDELVFEQHHRHHAKHRRQYLQQQEQQQKQKHHKRRRRPSITGTTVSSAATTRTTRTDKSDDKDSGDGGGAAEKRDGGFNTGSSSSGSSRSSSSLSTATTLSDRELNDVLENAFVHGNESRALVVRNGRRNYSSGVPTSIPAGSLRCGSVEDPDAERTLHLLKRIKEIESGVVSGNRHHPKSAHLSKVQSQHAIQPEASVVAVSVVGDDDSTRQRQRQQQQRLQLPGISGSTAAAAGFEPRLSDALPRFDADRVTRYGTGCYNLGTKPEDLVGTYLRHRREYTAYARESMHKKQDDGTSQQQPAGDAKGKKLVAQPPSKQQQQQQQAGQPLRLQPQTVGEMLLPRLRYTSRDLHAEGGDGDDERDEKKPNVTFDGMQFLEKLAAEAAAAAAGADAVGGKSKGRGASSSPSRRPNSKPRPRSTSSGRRGKYGSTLGGAGGNAALNELRKLAKPGTERNSIVRRSSSRRSTVVLPRGLVLQAQALFANAPVDALRRKSSAGSSARRSPNKRGQQSSSSLFGGSQTATAGARHRSPSGRRGGAAAARRSGRGVGERTGAKPVARRTAGADDTGSPKDVGLKLIGYEVPDLAPPIKFEDAAMNRRQDQARSDLALRHDELRELIRQHDLGELMGHRNDPDAGVVKLRDVKKPRGDPRTIGLAKKLAAKRKPAAQEVAEEERRRRDAEEAGDLAKRGAGVFDSQLLEPQRTDVTVLHSYPETGSLMVCTDARAFVRPGTADIMHRTTRPLYDVHHPHHIPTDNEQLPRPGVDVLNKLFFATPEALRAGLSPRPPDKPAPKQPKAAPKRSGSRPASRPSSSPLRASSARLSALAGGSAVAPARAAVNTSRADAGAASRRQQQHNLMSPEQRRQAAANAMLARQEQRDLARDGAFSGIHAGATNVPHLVLKM